MKAPLPLADDLAPFRTLLAQPFRRFVFADTPPEATPEEAGETLQVSRCYQREFHFILSGHVLFLIKDALFRAAPGDVFVVDRWQNHAMAVLRDRPEEAVTAMLIAYPRLQWSLIRHRTDGTLECLPRSNFLLPDEAGSFFPALCNAALSRERRRLRDRLAGAAVDAARWQSLVLLEGERLARVYGDTTPQMVRGFIQESHGAHCTLAELSGRFGVSKFHLARTYRQEIGETIGETVEKARRDFVAGAQTQGVNQKQIAAYLGFSSASTYCRWLRRRQ